MRKKLLLSEIKEWQDNPRSISKERFEKLKENIQDDPELMEANPIFVREDNMTIYSGNNRMKAVAELGWTEVMCEVSDIDDLRAKKRSIILNSHAGDWLQDELSSLVEDIQSQGADPSILGLGDDIQKIIDQINEGDESTRFSDKNAEVNMEELKDSLSHKCPRCGFEFP